MVKKAVILAGGLGTRFFPQTKTMPKAMLPLLDKPLIQVIVEDIIDAGVEDIVVVIRKGKEVIKRHFESDRRLEALFQSDPSATLQKKVKELKTLPKIRFVYQSEKLYGNAIGLLAAEKFLRDENFLVLWEDAFYISEPSMIKQLLGAFLRTGMSTLCVKEDTTRFEKSAYIKGVSSDIDIWNVERVIEKPGEKDAPSNLFSGSGYILTSEIFPILRSLKRGQSGEYTIADALNILAGNGRLRAYEIKNAKYIDIGDHWGYLNAIIEFALHDNDLRSRLMEKLAEIS
jgi:UTP--glucose-1-phosphate uridylyltransferase